MQPSSNPCFLQTILYRVSHPLFKSNHKYHYVRKYKGRLGIQVLPKLSVHSRTCMVVFRAILTYRITNLVLNSLIFLIYFFLRIFFPSRYSRFVLPNMLLMTVHVFSELLTSIIVTERPPVLIPGTKFAN